MLIKQAIGQFVGAHAGVQSIAEGRVYGGKLPQVMEGPSVLFMLDKSIDMPVLRNAAISVKSIFKFGCVAKGADSYMIAALLAHELRLCLNGFAGTITDDASPQNIIIIKGIFRTNERDYFDDPTQTDWVTSDWEITHTVDPLISNT